jgi:chromosome segregation ATPase
VADKKRKTADYVRTVTHFLDCVEAQAKAGRDLMEHEAEQAAVLGSQSDLREQIREVDDQLTLMKNELVNLQRDLSEAKKIRDVSAHCWFG